MGNYSAEDAKKRYEKLPPEVKNLLYTPGMSFTIQQIGQKNKLHLDQIDILNTETGQLMLGFIEPKDFPAALMEMLSVDRMKADALIQDINDMLLAPVREAMKKVYESTTANEKSVVMPSSTQVAPKTESPKPVSVPVSKSPVSSPPAPAATPTKPVEMHAAELMLSEPTISMPPKPAVPPAIVPASAPSAPASSTPAPATPKVEPPQPAPYKTDPYREPPE